MNLQTIRADNSEDRPTHKTDASLCKGTFRRLKLLPGATYIATDDYGQKKKGGESLPFCA